MCSQLEQSFTLSKIINLGELIQIELILNRLTSRWVVLATKAKDHIFEIPNLICFDQCCLLDCLISEYFMELLDFQLISRA